MKLYAPYYYKSFTCIADKCRHSCCIGWEIDVDGETAEKYAALNGGYGDTVRTCLDTDDVPHFPLLPDGKCPHLDENGLCRIILNLGEDYLCEICREHPRFYNTTVRGKEVGVGMSCEEACRLILESDDYSSIIEIGDFPDEIIEASEFDTVAQRNFIYGILSDGALNYKSKLRKISEAYDVSPTDISDAEWKDIINSLEYLDESHKELFLNFSTKKAIPKEYEKYAERALAYFVYRHCAEADSKKEFSASLGFCLFCEKLLASLATRQETVSPAELYEYARIISEELEYSESNTEAIKFEFSF